MNNCTYSYSNVPVLFQCSMTNYILHNNITTYLLKIGTYKYDFFWEFHIIFWSIIFNTSGIPNTYCTDSYVKINSLHNLHKPYIFEIFIVLLFIFRGCQRAGNYKWTNLFSGVQWKVDHIFIESKIVTTDTWKKKNAKLIANFYKRIIIMKIIYILTTYIIEHK